MESNFWENDPQSVFIVREQKVITTCALDIIETVERMRGLPLQPRDRMALKLLTPKNSALLMRDEERHLGCRQVSFNIITDDLGMGVHRLVPSGVHVLNQNRTWWSDSYGIGRFLWNLYLGENTKQGMGRILERLFKFKLKGLFGPKANLHVHEKVHNIEGELRPDLRLYIQRREGSVETTFRKLAKSRALFSAKDLGLPLEDPNKGKVALVFGKSRRYAVSFSMERL